MTKSVQSLKESVFFEPTSGFSIDISHCESMPQAVLEDSTLIEQCLAELRSLESGELVNQDEKRMVGHYWLRNPSLSPSPEIRRAIEESLDSLKEFAADILSGGRFTDFCLVGIGGSALGPQLIADALAGPRPALQPHFLDNTDPIGILKVLATIPDLSKTLFIIISKSGGTPETRNGMEILVTQLEAQNLSVSDRLVAITQPDSLLSRRARDERWLAQFPIWDWVGGRTSISSAVGILPALLSGIDVDSFLDGMAFMDHLTRAESSRENPALILASVWRAMRNHSIPKDMVVLPYRDELLLMSRYLQQLVMESLGKEFTREGKKVEEGIAVYGNKGSTDQHAYVQQLRDGLSNFFATFIEVLSDSAEWITPERASTVTRVLVDRENTSGEYLSGFLHGTRQALLEKGRPNVLLTIPALNPYTFGMLLALFERAVTFYGSMAKINAYHQPGVEAGKRAASAQLELKKQVLEVLRSAGEALSLFEVHQGLISSDVGSILARLRKLEADGQIVSDQNPSLFERKYRIQIN